jgi:hypothetical protein
LGGTPIPFFIPQDTDNVVVKFQASTSGGAYSALFQTTDDGGTTWYDVARTSIVSNTGLPAGGNQLAQFLSIPVAGSGQVVRSSVVAVGSIISIGAVGGVGNAAASTLTGSGGQYSGLPLLSTLNRVFIVSTGTITATSIVAVEVKVNSQARI